MAYVLEKMQDKLLDKITELLFQEYEYVEICTDIIPKLNERIDFYHNDVIDKDYNPKDDDTSESETDDDTVTEKITIRHYKNGIPKEIATSESSDGEN
tara:strand:- start:1738 stop:2031 length:294 start_codon:yes stop_codon:yes gene_type:complete